MKDVMFKAFIDNLWREIKKLEDVSTDSGNQEPEVDIPFSIPTIPFTDLWNSDIEILNELKRVFFRLTEKKDGCFVPLWDMMDPRPHSRYDQYNHKYWFDRSDAHNWLAYIMAQTVQKTPSPVDYDYNNAVFIKEASTFDIVSQLDKAFAEWTSKEKKM